MLVAAAAATAATCTDACGVAQVHHVVSVSVSVEVDGIGGMFLLALIYHDQCRFHGNRGSHDMLLRNSQRRGGRRGRRRRGGRRRGGRARSR